MLKYALQYSDYPQQALSKLKLNCVTRTSLLFLMISSIALVVNAWTYQYPGNDYFPPNTLLIQATLLLMYLGFYVQHGKNSRATQMMQEVFFFFLIMTVIIVATNAAQYTPFAPIDKHLLAFEAWLPFRVEDLMAWTAQHPRIKQYFEAVYLSLTYQMTYLPLLIILLGRTRIIREYYFLLLVTALLGYGFYYFFPTTAPASMLTSPYFSDLQYATSLKFNQIHQHIQPTTLEGGMIAFPSFHVIWAWLCVYLLRPWPIAFVFLGVINASLVLSCVMLGWHYPIDVLGSIIVIGLGHALQAHCRRSSSE